MLALCLVLCSLELGLYSSAHAADAATFTTFDAPGSLYTFPASINPEGAITGFYIDASLVYHGFLRAPDGTFTTFDVPGATPHSLVVESINPEGAITGYYIDADASFVTHRGFLRALDGTFTTFDAPGANGTFATSINPEGAITGYYVETSFSTHGFLLSFDQQEAEGGGQQTNAPGLRQNVNNL